MFVRGWLAPVRELCSGGAPGLWRGRLELTQEVWRMRAEAAFWCFLGLHKCCLQARKAYSRGPVQALHVIMRAQARLHACVAPRLLAFLLAGDAAAAGCHAVLAVLAAAGDNIAGHAWCAAAAPRSIHGRAFTSTATAAATSAERLRAVRATAAAALCQCQHCVYGEAAGIHGQ